MDDIGPKTETFLAKFGENFAKSYPAALFLRLKAEFEEQHAAASSEKRELIYRSWDLVSSKKLHSGQCWMRSGPNEGAFGSWSEVHLVELPDGNLGVFPNAQAAAAADPAKAKEVIRTAGYKLVREVKWHYEQEVRNTCFDLQCDQPEVGYPRHAWALAHGVRTNYIFQLSKPPSGCPCGCFGSKVQPMDDEPDSSNTEAGKKWQSVVEQCIGRSSPRDLKKDEMAITFDRTVKKMSETVPDLSEFSDDGTEGQILAHLAFVAIFEASCKQELLEQVRRLPLGRLLTWHKGRGGAALTIERLAEPAWKKMQDSAKAQSETLAQKVRPIVHTVLQKKAELQDLIRAKVGEKIGQKLSDLLRPVLSLLTDPLVADLSKGVVAVLEIYEKEAKELLAVSSIEGPLSAAVIASLDQLARDSSKTDRIDKAKGSLEEILATAKRNSGGVLESLDAGKYAVKWRQSLLELLDAMAFTSQDAAAKSAASMPVEFLLQGILAKAKADATALQKSFVSDMFVDLLLGKLKELTKEHTGPVIEQAQSNIPDSMSDIIDIEAEYTTLLEITIGAAIGKAFEPRSL